MKRAATFVSALIILVLASEGLSTGARAAPPTCKPNGHWACATPTPTVAPTPTPPPGIAWSMHPNGAGADGSTFEVPPFYNGRTNDPSFSQTIPGDLGGIIEQQTPGGASQSDSSLWVINPPAPVGNPAPWCVWDADDKVRGDFVGTLAPAQTVSVTICMIADTHMHRAGLTLLDYPQLVGSITFAEHMTMTVVGGRPGCIVGPKYDTLADSRLSPIANTNAPARGRYQSITFSVTNPTASAVSVTVPMILGRYQGGAPEYPETRWCPGDNFPTSLIWQYGNWLYDPLDVSLGIQPGVWWAN